MEILLNEPFSLDDQANEIKIEDYASNTGVKISVQEKLYINLVYYRSVKINLIKRIYY